MLNIKLRFKKNVVEYRQSNETWKKHKTNIIEKTQVSCNIQEISLHHYKNKNLSILNK